MNIAVILAGGIGQRVGAERPKQFLEVLGKPVLIYTLECFEEHADIDMIEIVCHPDWKDYLNEILKKYNLKKVKWIADGGNTFQESVMNGINYLQGKINNDDVLVIHFGASPFVTSEIISDSIQVCKEKGNAISTTDFFLLCGKKKNLTSVNAADNCSEVYIDRDTIACMNSPHSFKYEFIYNLYSEAVRTGVINEVEPHTTTLMYKMGKKIYFSKGSQINIKITQKEDLELFEGYVLMKKKREKIVDGNVY